MFRNPLTQPAAKGGLQQPSTSGPSDPTPRQSVPQVALAAGEAGRQQAAGTVRRTGHPATLQADGSAGAKHEEGGHNSTGAAARQKQAAGLRRLAVSDAPPLVQDPLSPKPPTAASKAILKPLVMAASRRVHMDSSEQPGGAGDEAAQPSSGSGRLAKSAHAVLQNDSNENSVSPPPCLYKSVHGLITCCPPAHGAPQGVALLCKGVITGSLPVQAKGLITSGHSTVSSHLHLCTSACLCVG